MDIKRQLLDNAKLYISTAIILPLSLVGFYSVMDARHDAKGTAADLIKTTETDLTYVVTQNELRQLRREKRKLENYLRLAPDSNYTTSRQAEVNALDDEITELEDKTR